MVGTISAIVIAQVMAAIWIETQSEDPNPGWVNTEPKALTPANRIAA